MHPRHRMHHVAAANVNDGSCEFDSCTGCLSETACNYEPNALYAAECVYPEEGYNCEGSCLSDVDQDGVCDEFETAGCTLIYACNFNPFVTIDDGSCDFSCVGCTDMNACNFDPLFTIDDGSCEYLSCLVFGCSNPVACNFDEEVNFDDGSCEFVSCQGCQFPEACNYDPAATIAVVKIDLFIVVACHGI